MLDFVGDRGGVNHNVVAVLVDEFVEKKRHWNVLRRDFGCLRFCGVLTDHRVRKILPTESERASEIGYGNDTRILFLGSRICRCG